MTQRLQQVLKQIKTLSLDELLQVNQAVQERLALQELAHKRHAFYQALQASGLVRHMKPRPPIDLAERQLIECQGKLVSQTIIEERR